MDSLSGISANTPLINFADIGTVAPSNNLLASELSFATPSLFGSTSTLVELSGTGQLLSAATTFQNQLLSLKPGTATSGGGQNFGSDFASLAAEVQNFVDAFNSLQSNIANISNTNNLLGGSVTGDTGLIASLNAQAQASFANGTSTLTTLSQLGITFQPPKVPGGGGSLSVNLSTLQSAFNTNAAGAFSLLSNAANAFGSVADSFITQGNAQNSSVAELTQVAQLLNNGLFSQAQTNDNFSTLLAIESLTGNSNMQQVIRAINEYALVTGVLA